MKSVPLWSPQYSKVLIFSRPLPIMYFQWVPMYPPVGYPGITRWAGVVPGYLTGTQWVPGYPISYLIGYPGSVLPGYGSPSHGAIPQTFWARTAAGYK